MLLILSIIIAVVSLACWIMILIKIFQSGATLWGVLGICPLVAFIYGWIKVNELDAQKIMLAWSACVALNFILNLALGSPSAP
jgi:hypothetical protein